MGRALFDAFDVAKAVFREVEEATGTPVARICFEADDATLRQTQNAQLALYTCGLAAWRALEERLDGRMPQAMAGHSIGEYAAVVASGGLGLADGARLVARRGELMAQSGGERPGTMAAALGLERAALDEVCRVASTPDQAVVVANDNSPGQLVISGDVEAVQRASALAAERGAKRVVPLNVSGAFHSPLMEPSALLMGEALRTAEFGPSSGPAVYCNVTGEPQRDPAQWPFILEEQLRAPVLWHSTVLAMRRDGIATFVECGAGEVLTGLLRRIDREATGLKVVDPVTLEDAVACLREVRT
jgi:[acyl-carrier-protein] S-malonyltransferase